MYVYTCIYVRDHMSTYCMSVSVYASFSVYSYNRVSFSDDSSEHRLELGSFLVHNLTPNTPPIYQVTHCMYIYIYIHTV